MIDLIQSEQLLYLLTWLSPGFPTGGFAWSHGLEFAVEAGDIHDAASLTAWLDDILRRGAGHNDAILLRHAFHANDAGFHELAEFAAACAPSQEITAETLGQGGAFMIAASLWMPEHRLPAVIAYPVAVGALAALYDIDEDAAVTAYLHGFVANLISAGLRLIPLGQNSGLKVQKMLLAVIVEVTAQSRHVQLEEIGGCCLRADIATMRHETQYVRLFRS